MPLFALMGPCQNVELGEVRRQIIKRSGANRQKIGFRLDKSADTDRNVARGDAYCMVVKTGSSSVRNTKGSSL